MKQSILIEYERRLVGSPGQVTITPFNLSDPMEAVAFAQHLLEWARSWAREQRDAAKVEETKGVQVN